MIEGTLKNQEDFENQKKALIEKNEMLAQFVGMTRGSNGEYYPTTEEMKRVSGIISKRADQLNFDNSLDWLKVVLEKVKSIDTATNIEIEYGDLFNPLNEWSLRIVVRGTGFDELTIKEPSITKAVFKALVRFVKWYNENQKSHDK